MTRPQDFTLSAYVELLRLAKATYAFTRYREIDVTRRFVLWRHDCDFSLNRAARLAEAESAEGVSSTYFLNPHSEFYNLLEAPQCALVRSIVALGHDVGLHFDAGAYEIASEAQLSAAVAREASWLQDWFGVSPAAVSFHNPTVGLASYEADEYGGLINCYARRFKESVPYVSDSNGFWRFRNLHDVLERAEEPCLQVLTHPEWWQDQALYPRERVFRSCYGRARATMRGYDAFIDTHGRENVAGPLGRLSAIDTIEASRVELCDFLWNTRRLDSLFLELWRLLAGRATGFAGSAVNPRWIILRDHLLHAREVPAAELEEACLDLCRMIEDAGAAAAQ